MNEWYQDTVDQRILFATAPDDVSAGRFVLMRELRGAVWRCFAWRGTAWIDLDPRDYRIFISQPKPLITECSREWAEALSPGATTTPALWPDDLDLFSDVLDDLEFEPGYISDDERDGFLDALLEDSGQLEGLEDLDSFDQKRALEHTWTDSRILEALDSPSIREQYVVLG